MMAISLQDQLLKAGLANKQQANKVKAQKRKESKQGTKTTVSDPKQLEQVRLEKAARDKELNKQRDEEKGRKAAEAEVRQLIDHHKVRIGDNAETPYRFVDGKLVKNIYVTPDILNQLARTQLAISKLDDRYQVIPAEIADRIEARLEGYIIRIKKEEKPAEDDPYAAYQVPDDLMW